MVGVEPPEIAVARMNRAGAKGAIDPLLGENAVTRPAALRQHQKANAGLVLGMNEDPTAPVATARNRDHWSSIDFHYGIAIAVPMPALGGTDRRHERVGEDLGQWAAK